MSIIEVARAAGVSTATVSRVVNDLPGVRDETVQRVRAAIETLRYRPKRLRPGRSTENVNAGATGDIAVLTLGQTQDWLQLPVMASTVTGIQRASSSFGFRILLDDVPDPSKPIALLRGRRFDGAIVFMTGRLPVSSYEPILTSLRAHAPTVWVMGMEMTMGGVDHVTQDNIGIGYLAHSFLRSRNCERLAYLTCNPEWSAMRLRGQAFLNAAYDGGMPASPYVVTANPLVARSYGGDVVSAPTLEDLVATLARAKDRPDGLFVANDCTTARLYPILIKNRIRPGRDITIISCDNEEIRLSALRPRPASIDIGAEEIGFRAVVRLRSRIQRATGPSLLIQVAPKLVLPGIELG
jgi:LacI family transcriptional regulator